MPRVSERQLFLQELDQIIFSVVIGKRSKEKLKKLLVIKQLVVEKRFLNERKSVPKHFGMRSIIFTFGDGDFRQISRMSKATFIKLYQTICDDIVFKNNSRNEQLAVEYQLIVALERLGCSGNGASVGRFARSNGIGTGTVTLFCKRVFIAINRNIHNIKWPNAESRAQISARIFDKDGIPNCVGMIDGTMMDLYQKPGKDGEVFWTRHKKYSFNATVICDDRKRIVQYQTGWPGSVHDNTCYKEMNIYQNSERYFSEREYLLDDSAYSKSMRMLVPFIHPAAGNPINGRFNAIFSAARVVIEHVYGILKNRWESLNGIRTQIKAETAREDTAAILMHIVVCFILHNFTIDANDEWEDATCTEVMFDRLNGANEFIQTQTNDNLREIILNYLVQVGSI